MLDTPAPASILLVDDLPANLLALEALLAPSGHRLVRAASGHEALRYTLQEDFAVILMDVRLGDMSGIEVTAMLRDRDRTRHTPVLLMTAANSDERELLEGYTHGAVDYLRKPLVPEVLRAKVAVFVELYLAREAVRRHEELLRALREAEGALRRRQAEDALRQSEERYRLVMRATSDVVWDWDPETKMMHWSDAVQQVFGWEKAELERKQDEWVRLIHPEDRKRVCEGLQRTLATRADRWQDEYRLLRRDGTYAFVSDRSHIVRDAEGRPMRMVGAMQDITEARRSEEERQRLLGEARRRVEFEQQLVAIVSHDLRGPLNAILAGASMVLQRDTIEPWQAKTAARILSCAERANRLIRDLLDFTQARMGGGIPVRPAEVDLHELTLQVVEEARVAHVERDIQVSQSGDGRGQWDADRIAQVISNLVTNALKYSPEKTPVRVETQGEAEQMVLRVHNMGEPIAADLLPRIFEPMRRGKRRSSRSDRSIGLGLYIVRELVHAHGGSVEVSSTEAEGTTFTVSLPRAAPVSPEAPTGG